jgi:hypothetical protein
MMVVKWSVPECVSQCISAYGRSSIFPRNWPQKSNFRSNVDKTREKRRRRRTRRERQKERGELERCRCQRGRGKRGGGGGGGGGGKEKKEIREEKTREEQ